MGGLWTPPEDSLSLAGFQQLPGQGDREEEDDVDLSTRLPAAHIIGKQGFLDPRSELK